ADLSVLFCDLRGFSRQSEQGSSDLLGLLARVSDALGVMTRHILDCRGVIGDFHGDAAMGFWGWPLQQEDAAVRAVDAASRIRDDYRAGTKVGGFRCGIGIATGRAVAGRIGTVDQVKVTAFGPVVNLASRLETLTKRFGVEVILDEATYSIVSASPNSSFFLRRLGMVVPAGFSQAANMYELMLPGGLTAEQVKQHQQALEWFEAGQWSEAERLLVQLPSADRPSELLLAMIRKYNGQPPSSWDKVVIE
ncbi:adenylate/guanylate cyclase domain-containing protein, partial [Rubripirellula amarantea]|nr:adenylate/guanylate cyclase domain-containing protein [Rubripirellula amarantea]